MYPLKVSECDWLIVTTNVLLCCWMAYVSNKRLADSIFKSVRLLLRWSGQQSFSKSLGPRTLGTKSAKHPTYNKSCIVFAGLYVIFKSNIISVMQLLSLGQVRSGQVRSGQVRSGQIRSDQDRRTMQQGEEGSHYDNYILLSLESPYWCNISTCNMHVMESLLWASLLTYLGTQ